MAMKEPAASATHERVLQRAAADADHRLDHHREHRRLDAEEDRLDQLEICL